MAANEYHFVTTWRMPARLSIVMRPIFKSNHGAMARGEESLKLELARRHAAADPTIQGAPPKPPGPTSPHNLRLFRRG